MRKLFVIATLCFSCITFFTQNAQKDTAIFDYGTRIYNAHIDETMSVDTKSPQNNPYNFTDQDTLQHTITFESLLDSNNMTFEMPEKYIEIGTIENRQMNYEKAYKHPTERFEVRFAIRKHGFGITKQIFEMTVLNISGGQLPEYTTFSTESVKNEFGADAGATVMVKVGKEFGQDYKYCLLVYIHKKGVGDGYIFYLADNYKIITDLMAPIFHALKFKIS